MRIFLLIWILFGMIGIGEVRSATEIELLVTDVTAGKTVFNHFMDVDDRFILRYRHSVEKTPVEEVYEVAGDGKIFLVETTVRSSGYGLPECGPGQDCMIRNGQVTFRGLRLWINRLVMRVSYLNDMWLIFEGAEINLRAIAPGGHRIWVQALKVD